MKRRQIFTLAIIQPDSHLSERHLCYQSVLKKLVEAAGIGLATPCDKCLTSIFAETMTLVLMVALGFTAHYHSSKLIGQLLSVLRVQRRE